MNKIMMRLFYCFVSIVFSASASANDQSKALDEIAKFAERICQTAPIKSHSSELQLSGKANAELKGLLSKVANLGIAGAAEYKKAESEGVLQKDLAGLLSKGTECKQKIVEKLIDKLITNAIPEKKSASMLPANWSTISEDTFIPNSGWAMGNISDEFFDRSDLKIIDGKYRWDLASRRDGERYADAPYVPSIDFIVAVDVRFVEVKSGLPSVQLYFGRTKKQWYTFAVSANQYFKLLKIIGTDGTENTLIAWTPININTKDFNRISVAVENSLIRLYINSKLVGSYKDNAFSGGKVGLAVSSYEPRTETIVDFANFELRSKTESEELRTD